jgi:hypothetical protein
VNLTHKLNLQLDSNNNNKLELCSCDGLADRSKESHQENGPFKEWNSKQNDGMNIKLECAFALAACSLACPPARSLARSLFRLRHFSASTASRDLDLVKDNHHHHHHHNSNNHFQMFT